MEESVEAVCYQLVTAKKQVPCTKKGMAEECHDIEVEVPSICVKPIPITETYPCKKKIQAPQCIKIAMCANFTTTKKSYPCMETKMKQECTVEEVPYEDTCTRNMTVDEPYDCSKEVKSKECKMVPKVCKRKVQKDIAFECSEKVCEKVAVAQVCYRKAKGKEAYPCTRTEYQDRCAMQPEVVNKTCYSHGTKPQQYPCKETKYETLCRQILPKTKETLPPPLKKEKKEKKDKAKVKKL